MLFSAVLSDCKMKSRILLEQSKVVVWGGGKKHGGNLELDLNAASTSAEGVQKACKAVLMRTTHSEVLQLNQIVSICLQRNSTTLKH